jgi:hypothetical protein
MFKEILLSGTIIAAASTLETYSQNREDIPLSCSSHIVVNTENVERKINHLSENDGIYDISKLVRESSYEEAWIFIPKKDLWIEIGYNETGWIEDSLSRSNSVQTDTSYIQKLMKENDELVMYHFHPIKDYDKPNDMISIKNEKTGALRRDIKTAIPSSEDLQCLVDLQKMYHKENKNGDISGIVVSHTGITEYFLTKSGKNILEEDIPLIVMSIFYSPRTDNVLDGEISKYEDVPDAALKYISPIIANKFISIWNNEFMKMKFYNHKEIMPREIREKTYLEKPLKKIGIK